MSMSSILVYGRDQRLLETRSWVLERAGYRVVLATDLAEAERLAKAEALEVAVLCHSLTAEESRAALTAFRRLRPEMRRLVMTVGVTAVADGQQEAVLSAYDGPRRLLEAVERLTREHVAPQ